MPNFNIILFDLGGTLIYFDGLWPAVLEKGSTAMFQRLSGAGLQLEKQDFVQTFRARLEAYHMEREQEFVEYTTAYLLAELLKEYGYADLPDSQVQAALNELYAVSQTHWHREDDTLATLETLRDQGYRMGLISNAGDDLDVQTLIDKAEIRGYFDVILTSAAVGIRKPNPRIFDQALAHWGADAAQAVMVGDTLGADILGAHNAGVFSIWITRRADSPGNRAHADTIQPQAAIKRLRELPGLLSVL